MNKLNKASPRDLAIMQQLLPYLELEVEAALSALDARAMTMADAGELTPEKAQVLLTERITYLKILRKYSSNLKAFASRASTLPLDI